MYIVTLFLLPVFFVKCKKLKICIKFDSTNLHVNNDIMNKLSHPHPILDTWDIDCLSYSYLRM